MNSQFKFKPDKIKYLSNVDTLDSTHKRITEDINKKRDDAPNKITKLEKIKNELENLELNGVEQENYLIIRTKLIEEIFLITEELNKIENYEEETEYYSKFYHILFNYYDMIDGQIDNEINIDLDEFNNNLKEQEKTEDLEQYKTKECDYNNCNNCNNYNNCNNCNNYNDTVNINDNNEINNKTNDFNILSKNTNIENNDENKIKQTDKDEWNLNGSEIFNSIKSNKLDLLNELSKLKRKEKKTTRKRVKNVESLVKDNNYNILDFIHSNIKTDNQTNTNIDPNINIEPNTNLNPNTNTNTNIGTNTNTNIGTNTNTNTESKTETNMITTLSTNLKKITNDEYNIYDRAILYEDYKNILEGYSVKKKNSKPCLSCNVDKVLIYTEGIYACMECGEVEYCIVENEITNYKDPMVEKPTFPYKRKNHFCELKIYLLLVKVINKNDSYFLYI